jgi:hypothetical protein
VRNHHIDFLNTEVMRSQWAKVDRRADVPRDIHTLVEVVREPATSIFHATSIFLAAGGSRDRIQW